MSPTPAQTNTEPLERSRLARNTVLLFIGNIAQALQGLCTGIILARYLGTIGFGQYAFVMTTVSLSGLFVELGFNTYLTRDVARYPGYAARYLSGSLIAKLGLAMAVSGPYLLVVWMLADTRDEQVITALLCGPLLLLLIACNASFASMFRAFEAMDTVLILNLVAVVGQVGGLLAMAMAGYGVDALVWWSVWVQGGRLVLSWWFFRRLPEHPEKEKNAPPDLPVSQSLARFSIGLIKAAFRSDCPP